ncbi:MAG: O-antigen ligase family protein [Fluviicola sp.]
MKDQQTYDRNYSLAISLVLFLCLTIPRLAGPALLLLGVWVLLGGLKGYLKFRWSFGLFTMVLLYSAYVVASFFTHHPDLATEGLVQKLSLVVIPILFSFPLKTRKIRYQWIVSSLILSVLILSFYGIIHGVFAYFDGMGWRGFTTVNMSPLHHPTYFMCFWILALVGAYVGWKREWQYFSMKWIVPFALFGLGLHVLSLSLAGILYLLVVLAFLVLYEIGKRWGWKASLGLLVPAVLAGYLIINYVPIVRGQWQNAKSYAEVYAQDPDGFVRNTNPWTGSEERLLLWIVSTEILVENPMGLGAKNYDDAIYNRLKYYGQDRLAEKHFNPHNQYLTTGIEIGVIGIFVFVFMLVYGFIHGLRKKHWLLVVSSSSLAFHCLFEAMLERQSGIVFYCLVLGICFVYPLERTPQNSTDDK